MNTRNSNFKFEVGSNMTIKNYKITSTTSHNNQ